MHHHPRPNHALQCDAYCVRMTHRVDPPDHAPEKEMLVAFLDYVRDLATELAQPTLPGSSDSVGGAP